MTETPDSGEIVPAKPKALAIADTKRFMASLKAAGIDQKFFRDLMSASILLAGNEARNFSVLHNYIIPEPGQKGNMTPEQFQTAREKFLSAIMQTPDSSDMSDRQHAAKAALILGSVFGELWQRTDSSTIGGMMIHPPEDMVRINPDGSHTPVLDIKNPRGFSFSALYEAELPDEVRYQLLPAHEAILAGARKTLEALRPHLQKALEQYKDEDPEDLSEDVAEQLDAAKRLLTRLDTGLKLPDPKAPPQLGSR